MLCHGDGRFAGVVFLLALPSSFTGTDIVRAIDSAAIADNPTLAVAGEAIAVWLTIVGAVATA